MLYLDTQTKGLLFNLPVTTVELRHTKSFKDKKAERGCAESVLYSYLHNSAVFQLFSLAIALLGGK